MKLFFLEKLKKLSLIKYFLIILPSLINRLHRPPSCSHSPVASDPLCRSSPGHRPSFAVALRRHLPHQFSRKSTKPRNRRFESRHPSGQIQSGEKINRLISGEDRDRGVRAQICISKIWLCDFQPFCLCMMKRRHMAVLRDLIQKQCSRTLRVDFSFQ